MYSERRLPQDAVVWRSVDSRASVIAADGCVDLILRDGRISVAGPSTRWIATESDTEGGTFGIRLLPGRAGGLLRIGLTEIADGLVPLEDVVTGERARHILEAMVRFGDGPAPTSGLAAITGSAAANSEWSAAVHRRAAEAVPAQRAAVEFGESERTFRRRMLATFWYGYATLVRIERARRAQALLRGGAPIAEAAASAGFADQPHLSREFRRLVGASPGQFAGSAA